MAQQDHHQCECGERGVNDGMLDGYPALKCPKCGKRWWYVWCWKYFRHIVDSRFAKKCDKCGWRHCPECNACNPDGSCCR